MNRTKLKNYAPQARLDFIQAMTDRAAFYGLTANKIEPVVERGDVAVIGGRSHPREVAKKRKQLEDRIKRHGFEQTMEALAYTWFNRLVAIRFMEVHGYLDHGYRVLSHPEGKPTPEILEHAEHVDLPGLKKEAVIDLKLAGNKETELYRLLLTAQCNALNTAMPFLFEKIDDETELLLPDNLLHSDSLIRKLVNEIDEPDWQEVEIIGWLYQFYISEKKDEVIGKVVASEDIPAATQLFTPNWIVKYLVQNTLGRQWLATNPQSALRQQMPYYIEPAEQTPEVQEQLKGITPTNLNPEELTFLDPACGSAHILVEAYDVFKAIYQERGYRAKDIPALILQKNLFGLEIDDRAAQLAAFALMMKARADDRRIFDGDAKPNIVALQDGIDLTELKDVIPEDSGDYKDFAYLHATYRNAKTFGSLIQPVYKPDVLHPHFEEGLKGRVLEDLFSSGIATHTMQLLRQHRLLTGQYDAVVANPPYMGSGYYSAILKEFVNKEYKDAKADLYACFIKRNTAFAKHNGFIGMITIPNWMFLSSFEDARKSLLKHQSIDTFIHNGRGVFGSDFGSCAFAIRNAQLPGYRGSYRRLFDKQGSVASNEELNERFFATQTFTPTSLDFARIPASPVAYWVKGLGNFAKGTLLSRAESGGRFKTHNDERYVRYWWEVSSTAGYWKRYLKGGEFRRFFGNEYHVADWRQPALADYESHGGLANPKYHQRTGITCSKITAALSSFRVKRENCEFSSVSPTIFLKDGASLHVVLAYLNSRVSDYYLAAINPSITTNVNDILAQPDPLSIVGLPEQVVVATNAEHLTTLAQANWNESETSWDFESLHIQQARLATLQQSQEATNADYLARIGRMKELEEENNRLFLGAYGLQDEMSPEVSDDQITLYRPDRAEDIKRLLSYAIGCVMGRFSLDKPGLLYAHSGDLGFDPGQYKTFRADDDGIIPLLENDWGIRDDTANRMVEFIGVVWPKEHLEENLKFVADSLGPNNGEQPRDTIRRYLAIGFYRHHLSMYKKRPIYWLFSSGKQRAFQCLVYLHRYHEGTLARMRTEYVIPLQGQIAARIEQLEGDKTKASSTSHRNKLQKEQNDLKKQQAELFTFEEKLKHAADQKIALDLDDGVKANYGKFGDLLAESKAITGGKNDE